MLSIYFKRYHKECAVESCHEMVISQGVDTSKPLRHFKGSDGLTSTVSRGLLWGEFCYYHTRICGKGEEQDDWKQRIQQAYGRIQDSRQ